MARTECSSVTFLVLVPQRGNVLSADLPATGHHHLHHRRLHERYSNLNRT